MPAPTKRLYSAKETYHLKEITNRSYPILFASVIIPWSIHNKGPRLRVLRTLCLYGHKNIYSHFTGIRIFTHIPLELSHVHTHTHKHTLSLFLSLLSPSPPPPPLSLSGSHTHTLSLALSLERNRMVHTTSFTRSFSISLALSLSCSLSSPPTNTAHKSGQVLVTPSDSSICRLFQTVCLFCKRAL